MKLQVQEDPVGPAPAEPMGRRVAVARDAADRSRFGHKGHKAAV